MKLIIAGSRGITLYSQVREILDGYALGLKSRGSPITEVVSGGARGVDQLGEQWANRNGIPIKQFIPEWDGYAGKRAGLVRNTKMAEYVGIEGGLVAFWDGKSKGTGHMIETAKRLMIPSYVVMIRAD